MLKSSFTKLVNSRKGIKMKKAKVKAVAAKGKKAKKKTKV